MPTDREAIAALVLEHWSNRCPTRQDRLLGHGFGSAHSCPPPSHKTDDHGDDGSNNKAPNAILHLCCGNGLLGMPAHSPLLAHEDIWLTLLAFFRLGLSLLPA